MPLKQTNLTGHPKQLAIQSSIDTMAKAQHLNSNGWTTLNLYIPFKKVVF